MVIEVEMKFKLKDLQELEYQLIEVGAKLGEIVIQRDQYFKHPSRDFAQTDEALRIREDGNITSLTYKGPKFDAKSKTRVEHNIAIADAAKLAEVLEALGFTRVLIVSKERKIYNYKDVEFCLDEVEGLGSYLEVETIVQQKKDYQKALENLEKLLLDFNIDSTTNIRTSYLELLLEKNE
ncbi:MAG: class IV adenylate cyclase [Asgard group archaeon]|nr:class IV adenylate cyclase [Asgard group archaeon]